MSEEASFWDVLAQYHAALEDHYLDVASVRRFMDEIRAPALVVGGGQGLIVAEVRKQGVHCDGVDFSSEMVKLAQLRRGLTLVQADAKEMPFEDAAYQTIIYATGVVDFIENDETILNILQEGRRVVTPTGKVFVAFYRMSRVLVEFSERMGLLRNQMLAQRESLALYSLSPVEMMRWAAAKANLSTFGGVMLIMKVAMLSTLREKRMTSRMQKIFQDPEAARALIAASPEWIPYRNEAEIRKLFQRLTIPIKSFRPMASCVVVEI